MSTPSERASQARSIPQFLQESADRYSGELAFLCGSLQLGCAELASEGLALAVYL